MMTNKIPALSKGFYTTESAGGRGCIKIAFESLADLHAADEELRAVLAQEAGKCEPVAVVTSVVSRREKRFEVEILDNQKLHIGTWLYTSPPAPVAVVPVPTPYQPKGEWSFERCEDGTIVIRNGKDWTVIKSGDGPIYEQFLYRFCEQQMKELTAPAINENAEFEKWRNTQIDVLIRNGYLKGAEAFRNLGSVQWSGWQARAYLDKIKELNQ
jgi:hypothetical protein